MANIAGNLVKRSFSTSNIVNNVIKNVTIIGGGLMGSGIAQVAAQQGQNVTLIDVTTDVLKKSETRIHESLSLIANKLHKKDSVAEQNFVDDTLSRIKYTSDLINGVNNADLVAEAIVENINIKHKLFRELDVAASKNTVFVSNTSSLSIADLAAVTNRKDKFGGLHFFNPVPLMQLLEVVRIPETSNETYQAMIAWGKSLGKTCITCKDTPGFVTNRLLVPYLAEAIRLFERGDAAAKDIDTAMKLGAGYSIGPLALCDHVGLDTMLFIIDIFNKKFPNDPTFQTPVLLKQYVSEGKLGRKSGEGFFKYNK